MDAAICPNHLFRFQVTVTNAGQQEKQLWSMGKKIVQGDM
jgi:hypothetical protein